MKNRNGFITNSSSSSFLVIMKNKMTDDVIKQKIDSIISIDKNHLLYEMARDIRDTFIDKLNSSNKFEFNKDGIKEFLYDYCYDDGDEEFELFKKYGNIAVGSFHDDDIDNYSEFWLCMNDLNYEDDDILIVHDGGY